MKRMTALENSVLSLRRIEATALDALDLVRLSRLANEYTGSLSGSQKKLRKLAQTLIAERKMGMLDEPSAEVNRTLLRDI